MYVGKYVSVSAFSENTAAIFWPLPMRSRAVRRLRTL
jgi:hypothetical protein